MSKLPPSMRIFERGWLSANNILFIGRDETALVDSGYVTHAPQTLALVRHALGERKLDLLVNTHMHSDHCGGNAALQEHYGCATAIPHAEADAVRAWDEDTLSYKATGQQCARFGFERTIAPGDELILGDLRWRALAAPGHDPRSLIFYCADEGILISADALWENGFGVIFPELDGESGFAEARATLALIGGLEVRLVIPGHGAPFGDAGAALSRANARLDYLEADPKRNAENAVKVLLKFLLLERQRIPMADVAAMFATIPVLEGARTRFLHRPAGELAEWTAAALVKAGAARRDGIVLVNAG
ncbi:MBL fold metallo-hydrolase [Massilia sp. R2A-15]|uniref:MBL fold metallo-hydrolase n=1 Tax=Massilia sp. R2A-15 TaxID=3064278 RepID=UPI002735DBC5|nr:MBL fold metallo-hydrolase [Massilia sp. R2A-15]WLI89007.1 MBL fold metallo-hydrolase [Massilia sp. R2A-15]